MGAIADFEVTGPLHYAVFFDSEFDLKDYLDWGPSSRGQGYCRHQPVKCRCTSQRKC